MLKCRIDEVAMLGLMKQQHPQHVIVMVHS